MSQTPAELRIGFLGAGFIANFHLQSLLSVRRCRLSAVWSPSAASRDALADKANSTDLGPCKSYETIEQLVDSGVDAIWIMGPNDTRVETVERIVACVERQRKTGSSSCIALACEKPLARTVKEAERMLELVEGAGLLHGYLENQVYMPSLTRALALLHSHPSKPQRPYLSRTSEEHSGPHSPWFWDPKSSGGGVMLDMMCHSFEAARFALSKPGQPRDALKVTKIQATTETLKWNRTPFSDALKESMGADYSNSLAPEDFARATVTLLDTTTNQPLIIECTTSWAYNGPGLRLSLEIMGPEYSVDVNTQNTDLKLFFSSNMNSSSVKIGGDEAGKETIEKANATTGLLPTIANEAFTYGYIAENQDMVSSFLKGEMPKETWRDGLEVMKVIMAMYLSADAGRTVSGEELEGDSVRSYVPLCTR